MPAKVRKKLKNAVRCLKFFRTFADKNSTTNAESTFFLLLSALCVCFAAMGESKSEQLNFQESNGDIRKSGSIVGKAKNMMNLRHVAIFYFFNFY